ncbi:MAG TPA: CDP-alcohol phosphatidyltransferase family protein [Polyangiaceae bacterium]|nr:CDP-alcohol phosphatidyltransferase family protein [Polyangiaceae bacterium]
MKAAEVYRVTRKASDLRFNLYICRPIAAVLVSYVQSTRVTPNQITFLSFAIAGVSCLGLLLLPGYWGLIASVAALELAYVFDCADGMLARLRGKASSAGHLLDFLMDELKAFLLLGAAATRLFIESGRVVFLFWGVFGLVALASGIALTTFLRRPEVVRDGPSGESSRSSPSLLQRAVAAIESVARFLIHYPSYIWIVAGFGRLEMFLYPYVAVNAAYAARALLGVAVRFGRFED